VEKTMLEQLEIEPRSRARSAVIWLHGLGADGHDFEPLLRQWGLADELAVRFVLPHAPIQPVTLNGGMRMRAWYDIYDLSFDGTEDTAGVERARQLLLDLLEREQQRGIDTRNIVLAGFSQGGALVLHTALRYLQPLAGVLALSAYLPVRGRLASEKRADPAQLSLRMDHGLQDQVVPYPAAQKSVEAMQAEGFRVDFNSYPMEHGLCPAQIDSLQDWLRQRLG
jgi:phospholipase/carboxylesterase